MFKIWDKINNIFNKQKTYEDIDELAFDLFLKKNNIKFSYRDKKYYRYTFFDLTDNTKYYDEAKLIMRKQKIDKIKTR